MTETIGFDEQTRSLYSLEAFKDRENGTVLHHLYNHWVTLPRGKYGLPHENQYNPKTDLPAKTADMVSWIDASAGDPLQYVIRENCENPIQGWGVELTDKPLSDCPEMEIHTTACAVEYLFCKHERQPMYHEIEQIIGGLKRHFTRIMLPVENDAGEVERIYFAKRQVHAVKRITFHVVGAQ